MQSGVHDRPPMDEEHNPDCNGGHEHQYERRRLANREVVGKVCSLRDSAAQASPLAREGAARQRVPVTVPWPTMSYWLPPTSSWPVAVNGTVATNRVLIGQSMGIAKPGLVNVISPQDPPGKSLPVQT